MPARAQVHAVHVRLVEIAATAGYRSPVIRSQVEACYQPMQPGTPLNGLTTELVIQLP
jgi:hypothetical protein